MAGSLGRLVAELALNTGEYFQGLNKAEYQAQQFAKSFDNAMSGAVKSLAGLAAGFVGVAALAQQFHAALSGAEAIDKLVKQTGQAAESLDRLAIIAKQNGTDVGALAKVYKELSDSMVKATVEGTKEQKIFEALGINVKDSAGGLRTMDAVMADLGKSFSNATNPAEQMVVATALFGKAGAELLPILKNWSAEQERATKIQEAFGSVTADVAGAADDFGDAMTIMGEGIQRSLYPIIVEMGPALLRIAMAFVDAGKEGTGFGTLMEVIAKGLRYVVETLGVMAVAVVGAFKAIGTGIAASTAAIVAVLRGDFVGAWTIIKEEMGDVGKILTATNNQIKAIVTPIIDTGKETNRWADSTNNMAKAAKAATTSVEKLGVAFKTSSDWLADFAKMMKQGADEWAKLWKEEDADAILKEAEALENLIEKLQLEADAVGLTATELALLNNERARAKAHIEGESEAAAKATDVYYDQIKALIELRGAREADLKAQEDAKKAYDDQTKYWESIADKAGDFFAGFIDGSKKSSDAVKQFAQTIKATLMKALFDMVARKWIVNIGMMMSGSAGAGGLGGGGGGSFDISSLTNMFSSGGMDWSSLLGAGLGTMATSLSLFSSLGAASTVGAAGSLGAFAGFGGIGSVAGLGSMAAIEGIGASAAAGLGAVLGAIGTVMPYVAIALLIAQQLGAFDHGGPKQGGFAATPGLNLGEMFAGDNNRYFTPNDADAMLQGLVDDLGASYDSMLASLGGKGAAAFALGYDTDPQGTANNRLHVGAWVNGKQVYNFASGDDSGSRDLEALKEQIGLEAQRALLAALQNSDLPRAVSAMLNQITAGEASAADIASAVEGAQAVKFVLDILARDPLKDIADSIELSQGGAMAAFTKMGEGLTALADNFDGSTEAAKALAAATGDYYKAQLVLLAQIEDLRTQLTGPLGLFGRTADALTVSTMTDDQKYDFYKQQEQKYQDLLATATTPEEIARYSQLANEALMNAWNTRTPDQQAAMLDDFLATLSRLDTITEERLQVVEDAVTSAAATVLDNVGVKLDDFANKILGAADKNLTAADKNLTAANTPINVTVTVVTDDANEVNV